MLKPRLASRTWGTRFVALDTNRRSLRQAQGGLFGSVPIGHFGQDDNPEAREAIDLVCICFLYHK